ncbi:MAG: hypothetical protein WBZ05_12195, partial [Desulfobacterales bacterium]
RAFKDQKILIINNFSEEPQTMDAVHLNACGVKDDVMNLITNDVLSSGKDLVLNGHQSVWLDIS